MPSAEPYLFNRTFDTASCNDADARATTADVAAAEPTYSAADLERARAEGIAFGRAEALAVIEDQRACERLRQATLTAIAERLGEVLAKSAESSEQAGRDGVTIAAAIARKLLPRLYREHARSEIESLVESVLTRVGVEPLVTVRLSPTLLPELVPALEAAAAAHDHQRHLRIKGDPEVAEGDCLLEWSGGGIIRDYALLWREIDAAIAQAAGVGAPAGDLPSPPARRENTMPDDRELKLRSFNEHMGPYGQSSGATDLVRTMQDLEAVYEIPVQVSAVLGRATMEVNQLLKLGRGAVVELDRKVGEPIDIYVNNRLVARGEVVVVEDRLGVTMTEIVKGERS